MHSPLFVFPLRQFSQPHSRYGERLLFFVPIAERRHGIDCALFLFRELNKGTKGKGNEAVGDTAQDTVVLSEDSV